VKAVITHVRRTRIPRPGSVDIGVLTSAAVPVDAGLQVMLHAELTN
jgi:hypothetical protein